VVVVGEQDKGTPPELAREIAGAIAGSRLAVIPDCGHLSTIERPEAVTDILVEWMRF
jgi:pimeloyl-ACP methyl ester carboxylesterase